MQPATIDAAEALADKIKSRTARVGIVGLGYVGLPLAVEFAKAGFHVTGIDVQESKVARLQRGESYIQDVPADSLRPLVESGKLRATTDFSSVAELDTINIAVPTPLRKTKDPDMSYIVSACQEIAKYFGPGKLVILESTTYPGTTDELVLPMLERPGLKAGEHFFLCFSPERVDPGNPKYQTSNIPKVVGGITPACTRLGALFYSQALEKVVPVSSTSVAEMVKLLENTFRMINIGLVNEMALMCDRMGINVWEVIDAAATKPFGFMPFYPGPGLGGHCIPIDPFYLSWKTKQAGIEARFIDLAGYINGQMPHFVVDKIQNALNDCAKPLKGSHVHILGIAYKRNIDDVRESPALDIILLLERRGARVTYSDPFVGSVKLDQRELRAEDPLEMSSRADCVVVVTDHSTFDYSAIVDRAPLIVRYSQCTQESSVDKGCAPVALSRGCTRRNATGNPE
ncbi:MAG TPA: nucleotide sugar dehydrogenase [Bryobacteraceae bacterium]|nr:nucleotide sugar dehydrogenase [Bryobacteraceae bacterium]